LESWEEDVLAEIEKELLQEDPVNQFFEIVQFQSYSKGKGCKRRFSRKIILIRPSGSKNFLFWDGESDCNLPWDEWATECMGFSGDALRFQIIDILD